MRTSSMPGYNKIFDLVRWVGVIGESLQQNQRCDSVAWGEWIFDV
jgi:hypothetical protein